jgi:hypothetical protein
LFLKDCAPFKVWSNQCKERQAFLHAHDWELDRFPFIKRLWWRYLLWPCALVGTTGQIYLHLLVYKCVEAYCSIADRTFGGSRYRWFQDAISKKIASVNEHNRQARRRFEAGLITSTHVRLAMKEMSRQNSTVSKTVH